AAAAALVTAGQRFTAARFASAATADDPTAAEHLDDEARRLALLVDAELPPDVDVSAVPPPDGLGAIPYRRDLDGGARLEGTLPRPEGEPTPWGTITNRQGRTEYAGTVRYRDDDGFRIHRSPEEFRDYDRSGRLVTTSREIREFMRPWGSVETSHTGGGTVLVRPGGGRLSVESRDTDDGVELTAPDGHTWRIGGDQTLHGERLAITDPSTGAPAGRLELDWPAWQARTVSPAGTVRQWTLRGTPSGQIELTDGADTRVYTDDGRPLDAPTPTDPPITGPPTSAPPTAEPSTIGATSTVPPVPAPITSVPSTAAQTSTSVTLSAPPGPALQLRGPGQREWFLTATGDTSRVDRARVDRARATLETARRDYTDAIHTFRRAPQD
ncbi:hypothetical protein MXD58_025070, partial [Frankia sp. AgKG'84/4]|nr:hypothetical protein [Frankia sp. AgKG'84/4]